ncbi:MAG: biotin/lipoyl-binding protein [Alistipes sp.]|nr:biotin/lipoyl-binding protein [Alistipes sp.]
MKDYSLKINGQNYNVQIDEVNEASTVAHVTVNGTPYEVEIAGASVAAASRPQVAPAPREAGAAIAPAAKPAAAPAASAGGTVVKCPLPGTVLAVKVAVGDTVAPGQTLAVLEAMKMENNIDASCGGVVKQILVQPGATVMEGDSLIVIG